MSEQVESTESLGEPSTPPTPPRRRRVELLLFGVLLTVLVGLVIALVARGTQSSSETSPSQASAAPATFGPLGDLSRRTADDPRALGEVDAPVTMVVFSDFRCPFCATYARDIEPQLIEKYVDAGKLRIEWRDQPIFGKESELAARAGWAAAAQGKFWQFVDDVYADAPTTGHPDLPIDVLVEHAKAAGVPDLERFRSETLSDRYDGDIAQDVAPTEEFGIIGVPAFVIDGEPIVGVRPIETFEVVIDQYLAGR
ncbi:DsbA family protein [Gordonia phosphorivorans]|uniref:DsbA family protein n=1 Tax=Gordonia phosphorivorans TaxID=1056982 RepID=A0ABV6H5P4_9ACTN